jgi:glycosyltransferase involved in cell wall biosynthesis
VLLDVSRMVWRAWSGRLPTGIDRVCLAYVHHYRDRAQAVVQRLGFRRILSPDASRRLYDLLDKRGPDFRRRLVPLLPGLAGSHTREAARRIYLNVGHTGLDQPGFRDWVLQKRVRPVYLVHDLIPLTHPQFVRAGEQEKHARRMETACVTGAGIVANSASTLADLRSWAASRNLPVPPATVAWLGTERLRASSSIKAVKPPYFVALGTIEGRKNHKLLLEMWRGLAQAGIDKHTPRLVIVGQRGWCAESTHAMLDGDRLLRQLVEERPGCTDEELADLLVGSKALLFPSFAEGFGMPLTEALGAGVPVVASDLPAFRELAGDIPLYLDPNNLSAWREAVLDFAADTPEGPRARHAHLARNFAAPTWSSHFARVDAWLEGLG